MSDIDDDEIPEYDESDTEGDRVPYLISDEHVDHQELFPDEEPA